jgi:uncharacterized membrane protein YhaH (DUF805 family)
MEYWVFELAHFPVIAALLIVGRMARITNIGLLPSLYILAVVIPSFAGLVRRLHDTNRSGWWLLINLVPLVGPFIVLSFTLTDSNRGPNRFGPSPKQPMSSDENAQADDIGYLTPPIPPERH